VYLRDPPFIGNTLPSSIATSSSSLTEATIRGILVDEAIYNKPIGLELPTIARNLGFIETQRAKLRAILAKLILIPLIGLLGLPSPLGPLGLEIFTNTIN